MVRSSSRSLICRLRSSPGMLALAVGLAGGGLLVGAVPGLTQISIGEALAGGVIVTGRVSDVFDDRFLIEDPTGRVLVETGSATEKPASISSGAAVRIEGRMRGRVLEARRITLDTGTAPPPPAGEPVPLAAAPTPAPTGQVAPAPASGNGLSAMLMRPADQSSIRSAVESAGFTVAGGPIRHDKHTEIPVRDSRGRNWVAWLDRFGRIEEVEIVDYDEDKVPASPAFAIAEIGRMVEREGFAVRAAATAKRHHFEVLATNQRSELVELHVDFAGQIYKQVWIR